MPVIKYDAYQRQINALLDNFRPEFLRSVKQTLGTGYMVELDALYSTMYHEWSTLQKDASDTMDAVSSLDWSVAAYVDAGQKPTPDAQRAADTVSRAIWRTTPQEPGTFAHSFLGLCGAMLDGLYRGVNVHEIIWARAGDLVYPAEYRQVPPQYYMWEMRAEQRDRLLMVRDGQSYANPEPFPAHRFIIALNDTGSDHPIYNSIYYSLISYFSASKFGLPWLQTYCQRYGHPVAIYKVHHEDDVAKLKAQLAANEDVHSVFLSNDTEMQLTPIPGSAGIPHEVLLRVAENACHQAILGQTLTSDTSQNGGSRAQAEVHLGVQKSVILKRAEYVARILNRQLVPAIIAANYGKTEGIPLPEIKFAIPDDGANLERADYWSRVLSIPGIRVAREHVYESLRIPIPADAEETLGGDTPLPTSTTDDQDDDPTTPPGVKKNAPPPLTE